MLWLSQALAHQGHAAMISYAGDQNSARVEGADRVDGLIARHHRMHGRRLRSGDLAAARAFAPTLIHALNPRGHVIAAARAYARATRAPVFVHWEDDEWSLMRGLPTSAPRRAVGFVRRLSAPLFPGAWPFPTTASLRWTREHALALDAIAPALAEHVRHRLGRPCSTVLPVNPPEMESRTAQHAIPALPAELEHASFIAYTGHIHAAREGDVWMALRAVAQVQAAGFAVSFVHAGAVTARADPETMASVAGVRPGSAYFLGHLPFEQIPSLLRSATVLIQPDRGSELNRLGLPSKLQAYLASGTPTITFAAGFGELLADRVEVLKTHTGSADELAHRIVELLRDAGLRKTLSEGGPAAAARLFDRERNARQMVEHYRRALRGERGSSYSPPAHASAAQ